MQRDSEPCPSDGAQGKLNPAASVAGKTSHSERRPLTDSPWFWAYLFATGALISLFVAQPRYLQRQPQIERQFAARQSGGQAVMGRDGPIPPSNAERMVVPLQPLYIVAALIMAVAWGGLCWQRFTQLPRDTSDPSKLPGDAGSLSP